MRLRHLLLLTAPLALVACNNAGEEDPADEILTAEEITATGDEIVPIAGEYRTRQELVRLEMPGAEDAMLDAMRAAFAEGAAEEETTYCVTEGQSMEDWVTDMAESNCNVTDFALADGRVDATLSCNAPEGIQGEVTMQGVARAEAADVEMSFRQPIPGNGEALITMRVISERSGDC